MGGKLGSDTRPVAIDHIDHARWHASLVNKLHKQCRRKWRDFRWFQNGGITAKHGRNYFQRDLVHWPVPWGNQTNYADRLPRHHRSRRMDAQWSNELKISKSCNEVFNMLGTHADLIGKRHILRSAHFHGHGLSHFLGTALIDFKNFFDICQTLGRRSLRPAWKCTLCRRNRAIGIILRPKADNGHFLFRGWVDHFKIVRTHRIYPSSPDVKFTLIQ